MMDERKSELREKYGFEIIDIPSEIKFEDYERIDTFLRNSLIPGCKNVIVNMDGVKYINSTTLSLLIKMMHELSVKKIAMHIMNASEGIKRLMEMTGARKHFQFIPNEQALMEKIQKEST